MNITNFCSLFSQDTIVKPGTYPEIINPIDLNTEPKPEAPIKPPKKRMQKKECDLVKFNYDNEDLVSIIDKLAALKCINIVFPQPPAKLTAKITFSNPNDMTLNEAWKLAITMLFNAGFSLVKKNDVYQVVPNANTTKEPLALYVNNIDKLPTSDQAIRFLYFFRNINIQNNSSQSYTNLDQMLKDMLSTETDGGTYILDSPSNTLLIVNRSSVVKSIMQIISELDSSGFRESIEVIPLVYTKPDFIAKIISQLIPSEQDAPFRYGAFTPKPQKGGGIYFSEATKLIPIERTGSLAIFGPTDSVKRVKDFIQNNLDLPIESNKSVIHVKPLQYLNADDFAPTLQNIVKAKSAAAQADTSQTSDKDSLANVVIIAEKQVKADSITSTVQNQQGPTAPTSAPIIGGNRLIVAARLSDWKIIDKLVDELDQPQLQVALEVLVTDISISDIRALGAQLRNSLNGINPSGINFQSSHLRTNNLGNAAPGPFLNFDAAGNITPQGLASDLSKLTTRVPYSSTAPVNVANLADAGSTILSFRNGNGIASIMQILDSYNSTTILSQPFVITTNNKQANISIAKTRQVEGGVQEQSTGGPIVRNTDTIKADLTVNILPRISKENDINLEILVNVNDFAAESLLINTITTRQVRTNSNLKNREVLVIGGLARVDSLVNKTETPILGSIPIIGYFFKKKSKDLKRKNLMIFISPTIIRPRLQGGIDPYTQKKLCYIKDEININEAMEMGMPFERLRDPVTRVFFPSTARPINSAIDYYSEQGAFKPKSDKQKSEKDAAHEKTEKLKALTKNSDNPLMKKREVTQ